MSVWVKEGVSTISKNTFEWIREKNYVDQDSKNEIN